MTSNEPGSGKDTALEAARRELRELMRRLTTASSTASQAATRIASGLRTIAGCLESIAASIDTLDSLACRPSGDGAHTAFASLHAGPDGRARTWEFPHLDSPSLS